MSSTLIATLGGLWAMLIWGSSDWLIARSSKKSSALEINTAIQIPGLLIILAIMFLTGQHMPSLDHIMIIGAAGLMFSFAFLAFIRSMALGSVGIVVPAASTFPLFTLIFSAIFVSIEFSHLQILSMLVIVAGVIILAFERRDKKVSLAAQHRATLFALLAAALWGVGNVIQNSIITEETWQIFLGFINISLTIFAFLFLFINNPKKFPQKVKSIRNNKTALLAGAIYTIGSSGFYYSSVRAGSIIIPLVVSSASPLITAALAAAIDKERLPIIKRAGAVVVVAGIILLNTK